jgi:hypothetical protein
MNKTCFEGYKLGINVGCSFFARRVKTRVLKKKRPKQIVEKGKVFITFLGCSFFARRVDRDVKRKRQNLKLYFLASLLQLFRVFFFCTQGRDRSFSKKESELTFCSWTWLEPIAVPMVSSSVEMVPNPPQPPRSLGYYSKHTDQNRLFPAWR